MNPQRFLDAFKLSLDSVFDGFDDWICTYLLFPKNVAWIKASSDNLFYQIRTRPDFQEFISGPTGETIWTAVKIEQIEQNPDM